MTVRIGTSDKNAILLDDAETRGSFARTGQRSLPAMGSEGVNQRRALGRDARAAGEDVQRDSLTEEDLADRSSDGGALSDRFDGLTFFDVPFDADIGQS